MKLLESLKDVLETCAFCPKLCRYACPVAEVETRESVTPWGLMTHADNLRRSAQSPGDESFELWSHCTGCGQCVRACKHDNPVPKAVMSLRAMAEVGPSHPLKTWAEHPPSSVAMFAALPTDGDVVLVPGFASRERIEASITLLKAAGYEDLARPIGDRLDSGWRLRAAGMLEAFETARRTLIESCNSTTLICLDVEDAKAISEILDAHAPTGRRAMHLVEALGAMDIETTINGVSQVALFAGCPGSAPGRDTTQLRTLLATTIDGEVTDAALDLPGGGCCGRGAGYQVLHPDSAAEMARTVLSEESGPVVAFGECAEHLRGKIQGRTVYEWTAFMAAALTGEDP